MRINRGYTKNIDTEILGLSIASILVKINREYNKIIEDKISAYSVYIYNGSLHV